MEWFENYLTDKLNRIKNEFGYDDLNLQITTEKAFVKEKTFNSNAVYVIIKYLTSEIVLGAKNQPIQLFVYCVNNDVAIVKAILEAFSTAYNYQLIVSGTDYIKTQFTSPAVIANFDEAGADYRSMLLVSGTLIIMTNVADVREFKINNVVVPIYSFSLAYQMTPNSQQLKNEPITRSVKSASSFSLTISIPMQDNDTLDDILDIIDETSDGNDTFTISFKIANRTIAKSCKLVSAQVSTAINSLPSLQVGFQK